MKSYVNKNINSSSGLAISLAIGSGVLYLLSWNYWRSYFQYFGIDPSFINITFHNIIASSWSPLLALLFSTLLFVISSSNSYVENIEDLKVSTSSFFIAFGMLSLMLMLPQYRENFTIFIVIVFSIVIFMLFTVYKYSDEYLHIGLLSRFFVLSTISGIFLLFYLMQISSSMGRWDAHNKMILHQPIYNIEMDYDRIYDRYTIIAYMDNNYFFIKKTHHNNIDSTIILNQANIKSINIKLTE